MSDPESPTPAQANVQVRTLSGEEAQAALREALQSVAAAFAPDGTQPGGLLGSLESLGRLSDPHVRDQINQAFAHLHGLQGSTVHGQATVIDLRGTQEGQALRGLVERMGAASLAARPGFAFHTDGDDEPQAVAAHVAEAPSSLVVSIAGGPPQPAADVVEAIAQTETTQTESVQRPSPMPSQPSLVEDAGGLFGWVSRLFGGRR